MAQKPMLRGEVGARALRVVKKKGYTTDLSFWSVVSHR
jgi:hypothetical protein